MTATPDMHRTSLATAPPGSLNPRLALIAILVSGVCFAVMAPFARTHLTPIPAFVPAYEAALAINDLITSVLLFGHFARLRRRSLLVISAGYLFNVCMIVVHALSFPGVFSATGLLGAGPQTTAWLFVFWHGGFPIFLLAYALLASSGRDILPLQTRPGVALAIAVGLVVSVAGALTLLSTIGQNLLPLIIVGGDFSRLIALGISPGILALTALAIAAMWRRRTSTVLDVWLFAVLWVWICDVSLSAVVGSVRYDLGWYGGRLFGLFAASFVLASLLLELNKLYAHLSDAIEATETRNAELVRSRSELARVQRYEAMGQLTGGIAHDFNNLLTAIVGGLDMIVRNPTATDKVERLAVNALKAADRGTRLISQLMTFARKQNLKPEVVNPNALLLEFEAFARRVAGASVEVTFELGHAVDPVRIDAAEFQAAMLNLISNARDAMPTGGHLRIESANINLEQRIVAEHFAVEPGRYATVTVSDTGVGMSTDTIAKAFEPFFTTKPIGQGTGLGLSQVYGFARSAHGLVTIESELGHGSKFTVYIPRSLESQLSCSGNESVLLPPAQSGETVLLVEDDLDVLAATEESLRELGYTVLSTTTGQAALVILQQQERIDILFSDVVMPGGMNGVQLATEARRRRPGVRVLLTSGYTGTALSQHEVPVDLPFLGKPYRRDELASKLRVVLSAR